MSHEIVKWQHSVLREASAEPSSSKTDGLASRLSRTASDLFVLVLKHAQPQAPKALCQALEREYGYLQLWCDGYGAVSGDLDDVLAESTRLRHSTYRLLVSLCQNLGDKIVPLLLPELDDSSRHKLSEQASRARDVVEAATFAIRDTQASDSDSDSETDAPPPSEDDQLEDVIEDLRTDIQCLVDLGPRYKEPIRDRAVVEDAALPTLVPAWDPAEYLTSRILYRYPTVDAELAAILGRANWLRALRLYACKEESIHEAQQQAAQPASASRPPGTVVASDFRDSGLGTSIVTPSLYAETILSYHGAEGGSIKIPPVPAEALLGKPFTCDICGRKCRLPGANSKSLWKRHVLADLQPYNCIVATCAHSTVPFPDQKQWADHLDLEHGFADPSETLTCPLCQRQIRSGKAAHLARHLEEVSLTILPANAESDEDSEASSGHDTDADAGPSEAEFRTPDPARKPAAKSSPATTSMSDSDSSPLFDWERLGTDPPDDTAPPVAAPAQPAGGPTENTWDEIEKPQAGLPPGHSYPPNIAHVTRQDLDAARQKYQRFQTMPDEVLIEFLRKARRDSYARKAWEQVHQTQQARGNNNATGAPKPAVPVPPTPAGQLGIVTAAPHPNAPQGVQTFLSRTDGGVKQHLYEDMRHPNSGKDKKSASFSTGDQDIPISDPPVTAHQDRGRDGSPAPSTISPLPNSPVPPPLPPPRLLPVRPESPSQDQLPSLRDVAFEPTSPPLWLPGDHPVHRELGSGHAADAMDRDMLGRLNNWRPQSPGHAGPGEGLLLKCPAQPCPFQTRKQLLLTHHMQLAHGGMNSRTKPGTTTADPSEKLHSWSHVAAQAFSDEHTAQENAMEQLRDGAKGSTSDLGSANPVHEKRDHVEADPDTGQPKDTPDVYQCRHCKATMPWSAVLDHIVQCLRAKTEKAQGKIEASEARARLREAPREEKAQKAEVDHGDGDSKPNPAQHSQPPQLKRVYQTCIPCRRRRVRCHLEAPGPCGRCRRDGIECFFSATRRERNADNGSLVNPSQDHEGSSELAQKRGN